MSDKNAIAIALPEEAQGLIDLVRRLEKAGKHRPEDLTAFREHLQKLPTMWRVFGDLCDLAAKRLVSAMAGENAAVQESMLHGRTALREELGYDTAPELERMLIEHVVLCWMRLNYEEYLHTNATTGTVRFVDAEYSIRKLTAAQRRYLRACETLARVRRLLRNVPAVQVNIATDGGRQVNVAGDLQAREPKAGRGQDPRPD